MTVGYEIVWEQLCGITIELSNYIPKSCMVRLLLIMRSVMQLTK